MWCDWTTSVAVELVADYGAIDEVTAAICNIDSISVVREQFDVNTNDVLHPKRLIDVSWQDWLSRSVSLAMGIAFGRLSAPRLEPHDGEVRAHVDPFLEIPVSPGFIYSPESTPVPWLVDDPGHSLDVTARLEDAWALLWPDDDGALDAELAKSFGSGLRPWVGSDFFGIHRRMYTTGKRSVPIYWQLGTSSGSFSVWLYLHALTRDTLFKLQNDYVGPRLAHEERKLAEVESELGRTHQASLKRELASQQELVDELRLFLAELKRVNPLWSPALDDGVLVNFSPLWRLVPQSKQWQKELRKAWEGLSRGNYDWTELAMRLWPERVIPKCAEDRSVAIAHGLEDVFWMPDPGHHDKSLRRSESSIVIDQLVAQRHNPEIAAALQRANS